MCELTRPVLRNPSARDFAAIKSIFFESDGVLWVTHGALMESSKPDLNLVAGLARTVRVEKGDTMIVTLDLDAQTSLSGPASAGEHLLGAHEQFWQKGCWRYGH